MTDALIKAALVLDANTLISIAAKEATAAASKAALAYYAGSGHQFYAPGVIVSQGLYALRNRMTSGVMAAADHAKLVTSFAALMSNVLPPPGGDASLVLRADQICQGYGASRSADALYLALAESLARTYPTRLLP